MAAAVTTLLALATLLLAPAATWAADPTRPPPGFAEDAPAGREAALPALAVGAVYLLEKKPYALVDGLVVKPGDPLGEGRVSRIDERGVWLKTAAGPRLLPLLPQVKKTPAGSAPGMEKRK
ncbi:MAG: hypothetical protein AB1899_11280 [Pseudomonadota bacterium]